MKLGKETVDKIHCFNTTLTSSEYNFLKDFGLTLIKQDDNALINYAVNKILEQEVKDNKPKRMLRK